MWQFQVSAMKMGGVEGIEKGNSYLRLISGLYMGIKWIDRQDQDDAGDVIGIGER